jgi:hypothetical protein
MVQSQQQERRHFHRIPLDRPASLTVRGRTYLCELADVSLKGALVLPEHGSVAERGDKVQMNILLDDMGDAVIHMSGEIAHVEDKHLGIQCHQLDLDSATLLRRVVELNLADADLLQRDLHAMIDAD